MRACSALNLRLCPRACSNVIKAGGGRLLPASRWEQVASGGGGGGNVDLVVCGSGAAPHGAAVAALVGEGAQAAAPLYVVEWLAKPKASLAKHVVQRRCEGGPWRGRARWCCAAPAWQYAWALPRLTPALPRPTLSSNAASRDRCWPPRWLRAASSRRRRQWLAAVAPAVRMRRLASWAAQARLPSCRKSCRRWRERRGLVAAADCTVLPRWRHGAFRPCFAHPASKCTASKGPMVDSASLVLLWAPGR